MLDSLVRHSLVAILLAVMVEELGIPMPIPTDIMIVFAGTASGPSLPLLVLLFAALTVISAVGASGLYAIVRHGGRPLVERFGRYVHLGPEQLARTERLLARFGWGAIAVGRATPGLRYPTVVACGLFKVPYLRFITAHLTGSSVYIAVFLALGAVFGPTILDYIHPPALVVRLLWLVPLALGLPLLMARWGSRAQARQPTDPSRTRSVAAALFGGFVGATALTAAYSTTAAVAELLGSEHPLNVSYVLLSWLLGLGPDGDGAALLSYAVLISLFAAVGIVYYELVLSYLAPRGVSLFRQALGLALLSVGLFAVLFACALLAARGESFDDLWWQTSGPIVLAGIVMGTVAYAPTTAYGRALAISAPSLKRR